MSEQQSGSSNIVIESLLNERIQKLEEYTDSDVFAFYGTLLVGVDDLIRDGIEKISPKKNTLTFIIESPGGYLLAVERIVATLRHYYTNVNFIVPNLAMSAGTVLVMSGNEIFMDYYSVLGPIDPQVENPDGQTVSAIGYLREFDKLVAKSDANNLTTAELAFMLNKFDPGTLYFYEQEKNLAVSLLEDWLVQYKFKNWTVTETTQTLVTNEMREETSKKVAERLNTPELWHSHSRGISRIILEEIVGLKIKDFSADTELNNLIRGYFELLRDYWQRRRHSLVIHTRNGYNKWST